MLALALTIGFYLLALLVVATLVAVPIVLHADGRAHAAAVKIDLMCLTGALAIAVSVLPRRERFAAPGARLGEIDQPRLFRLVREVAAATGERMPDEVYATAQMNAAVTDRGGFLGMGTKRILIVGLPLAQSLTVDELRAVLAHEFGHFAGNDTRVGAWLYRTRASIERTVSSLAQQGPWLRWPFVGYGRMFLRISHAVSRQQEYAADVVSARAAGAGPAIRALEKIEGFAPAWDGYLQSEFLAILSAGWRPPLLDGFRRFLTHPGVSRRVDELRESSLAHDLQDPHDTHPPTRRRIEALRALDPGEPATGGDVPSIELFDGLADIETRAVLRGFRGGPIASLETVAWSEVGARVALPSARAIRERVSSSLLGGATLADLPACAGRLGELGRVLAEALEVDLQVEQRSGFAADLLSQCALAALVERGFEIDANPGGAHVARLGDQAVAPRDVLIDAARASDHEGTFDAAAWRARCEALGIADQPLGHPS